VAINSTIEANKAGGTGCKQSIYLDVHGPSISYDGNKLLRIGNCDIDFF
jgi:hypothetical protein